MMNKHTFKLMPLLFLSGLVAGVVGVVLIDLLHVIQQLIFGFPHKHGASLHIMLAHTTATQRLLTLTGCGFIGGMGWWLIHRYGQPLVSIKAVVQQQQCMPLLSTLLHGLLQVITVAMGSPLGRESAPRQISTAITSHWLDRYKSPAAATRRLLLGCTAAAGLAAVYDVPFAGTLFALETLLHRWHYRIVLCALLCCSTAAAVTHWGTSYHVSYTLPTVLVNAWLWLWAILITPLLAYAAYVLNVQLTICIPPNRQSKWMLLRSPAAFMLIGLLSLQWPEILGNGQAGNELVLQDMLTTPYAIALLVAKWLALLLATWGGAYGGRITPAMMIGGLLGFILAAIWNLGLPPISLVGAAVIGATVFLGLLQQMPLTAIMLMLELSHFRPLLLLPLSLCLLGAWLIYQSLVHRQSSEIH